LNAVTAEFVPPRLAARGLNLRPAMTEDTKSIIKMIDEAGRWLRRVRPATDQWAKPWPSRAARDARVADGIERGRTWLVEANGVAAATVTVEESDHTLVWPVELRKEPAVYAHRIVVARRWAGLDVGGDLIDWAASRGQRDPGQGVTPWWLRIDVWATNERLHAYYESHGFARVKEPCAIPGYPASALFQRQL
jgi:GNAT superfamily N-acetyltransferase